MSDACLEQVALASQMCGGIDVGVVQDPGHLGQRHPGLPVDENSVDPGDVVGPVEPVAGPRARRGHHQTDLVPVVQGAHGHPDQTRRLATCPTVNSPESSLRRGAVFAVSMSTASLTNSSLGPHAARGSRRSRPARPRALTRPAPTRRLLSIRLRRIPARIMRHRPDDRALTGTCQQTWG